MTESQKPLSDPSLITKIMECVPGAFYVINADMHYVLWNRQVEELTGFSAEELTQINPLETIHPDDRNQISDYIDQLFEGKSVITESRLQHTDGSNIPIFFRAVPLQIGDNRYIVGSGLDLRDLHAAQERLQRSEARYRSIVESGLVGVLAIGDDYIIRFCNRPLADLLERPVEELVGSDFRKLIHKDSIEEVLSAYTDFQEGRDYPSSLYVRVITAKGHQRMFQVNLSPALNHAGDKEVVVHATDHTDRFEADTQRKRYAMALEKAARVASIGVVAGGITHEINQPLSALILRTETLIHLLSTIEIDPAMLQNGLAELVRDAERISEIVQHMRAYWVDSQEKGSGESADVNAAVNSATKFIRQRLIGADVKVENDLGFELLPVRCASIRLEQIIINLFNNAVNAFKREEWQGPRSVWLSTRKKDDDTIELNVADNGPGLPTDDPEKLFDPLYTTTAELGGTGLGLAIVKMFAEHAGGKVCAENRPGGGARFTVTLPVAREEC